VFREDDAPAEPKIYANRIYTARREPPSPNLDLLDKRSAQSFRIYPSDIPILFDPSLSWELGS
jgi:hypothetical protein